ncbi:MAG: hypothetical protein CMJ78_15565 [Planctomycetaceae bacterium]|nr:hypothetical protein [Planctomycetaceae bacterium]
MSYGEATTFKTCCLGLFLGFAVLSSGCGQSNNNMPETREAIIQQPTPVTPVVAESAPVVDPAVEPETPAETVVAELDKPADPPVDPKPEVPTPKPQETVTPLVETPPATPDVEPKVKSLDEQVADFVVPPVWLDDVKPAWDVSKPWKEGRLEIRRLLGLGKDKQRREALKLMWDYLQKEDMGNRHEYPMYTHLGVEPIWSVKAHLEFLAEDHPNPPLYAMKSLAAIYMEYGEFERAEKQIENGMKNLPKPPWRVSREAEFHDAFGDLYAAWGKLDKAKHHYEEAIRIYPTAKPPYGRHLLPRRAKKVQSKLEMLSYDALETTQLKDGTYRDRALGYTGDLNLTIKVGGGRIQDIDIKHTEKIDQNACVLIPKAIIDQQSLKVDGISGATVTKDAIVAGTYRALKQAGLK